MADTRLRRLELELAEALETENLCALRDMLERAISCVDWAISKQKTVIDNEVPKRDDVAPITLRCEQLDGID
jgi:hypothetical protein